MHRRFREILIVGGALAALAACGQSQGQQTSTVGYGYNPSLPKPTKALIPTVKVSSVVGWPAGTTPKAPAGFQVQPFATGLDHPRWLLVLPNGDVLVAESNTPPKKEPSHGLKGFFEKMLMKKAGAGVPSANRITLLRDADHDGVAELKTPFLTNLHSPFGMALVGDTLYVANADAIVAFPYAAGADQHHRRAAQDRRPAGRADQPPLDQEHHRQPGRDQAVRDRRLQQQCRRERHPAEEGRARSTRSTSPPAQRVFASGLRNPNGMGWNPASGQLWTSVNERDELGNDLVPDYMTSVRDGGFYGWPYSYYGRNVDKRVKPTAAPTWSAAPSSPTTPWAPTPPRWA
jgi:glucose/arabinose dehydrogenase